MDKFYLTTAIAYINASPHIGYAYEVIAADVQARFNRLLGHDTFFLTGSDEHSLNVEKKAAAEGVPVIKYCDKMAGVYKDTWETLGISYDAFIRTSEERHRTATEKIISAISEKGDIYKGKYQGWYCVSCEAFYQEKELIEKKCPVHKSQAEWVEEENYFFALSKYEKTLKAHILEHPGFIMPESRRNEILSVLESGLQDVSISRSRRTWGIPFPSDPEKVVYVWFDALINYISGIGYGTDEEMFKRYWPADVHIIGKDIIRFHCLIWPAMLLSAGLELPRRIFAHGFINIGGEKISKSKGNLVDPRQVAAEFGTDALRYFLLREVPFGLDGSFSPEALTKRFDSDLADDLGNLVFRTLTMVEKYFEGKTPQAARTGCAAEDEALKNIALGLYVKLPGLMREFDFPQALSEIWNVINNANKYIENSAPWKLNKENQKEKLATVIYNLLEAIRIVCIAIFPFMPKTALSIWQSLGLKDDLSGVMLESLKEWGVLKAGTPVDKGKPLFPRIQVKGVTA